MSVRIVSARACAWACASVCLRTLLPLGGGLMSVSPCWLELSDCPDSAQKQTEQGQTVRVSVCRFETSEPKIKTEK